MKRKFVLGFLAVQIMLACVTGCGKANNSIDGDGSATAITSAENTTDNNLDNENKGEVNCFDFDRAIKNVTIDGQKIQLPTTLNELGDEFSLSNQKEIHNKKYGDMFMYDLLKNNELVAKVSNPCDENIKDEDNPFVEFDIVNEHVSIEGITIGDDIKTVKQMFGKPSEFTKDTRPIILGDCYWYEKKEGDGIEFRVDENGKICKIYIGVRSSLLKS